MYHQRLHYRVPVQMSRFMPLEEFRKRFEVVDPDDLAARDINKYWDPFIESDG